MECLCSKIPSNITIIKVGESGVGIIDLNKILSEVYFLRIKDESALKEDLLRRAKEKMNYIPQEQEGLYAEAFLREYRSYVETRYSVKKVSTPPARQHSPGFLNFLGRLVRSKNEKK